MVHPLLFCSHCKERKPPLTPERAEKHFLFCSQVCKDTHEAEALARRIKSMATHDPSTRRPKTEGELRAMGAIPRPSKPKTSESQELAQPKKTARRKKGVRLCGKCGQSGHNARTCGRHKEERPKTSVPDQIAALTGLPVIEDPRKKGAPKLVSERPKGRKCGKCGKPGHNARTCSRGKPTSNAKKSSKRRQYKCGKCGGIGHNARSCTNE